MTSLLYEHIYKNKTQFSFGKNWKNFIEQLDEQKIESAKNSLLEFLGGKEYIEGKTFVDIGCGSGLFSLAAYLLGASKIISVDIDENSVQCAILLREKEGGPENWTIHTGSALDKNFIKSLGSFDIVYSWGVLHHSGDMYKAFDNIISLIGDDGKLFLAIYNKYISSRTWWYIKYLYNKTPNFLKFFWVTLHYLYVTLMYLIQGKWILSEIKKYTGRGMSFHTDVLDWLGGYPYEYMTIQEALDYFGTYGLSARKIQEAHGPACWQILFEKTSN